MNDYELLDCLKDVKVILESKSKESLCPLPYNLVQAIDEVIAKNTPTAPNGSALKRYCPACGRRIRDGRAANCLTRDNRCPRCGQLFAWE